MGSPSMVSCALNPTAWKTVAAGAVTAMQRTKTFELVTLVPFAAIFVGTA